MIGADMDLVRLFAGVGGILVLASSVGFVLARNAEAPNDVVDNFNARVSAWWVMVVLLGLAFLAGRTGVVILFALCSFAAMREFMTLTRTVRADHWAVAAAFFVVLPAQYILIWDDWYGLYSVFIPVYAFLLLPILAALRGETRGFLVRVAEAQWALMIAVFCVSHVPALLYLEIPGFDDRNVLLIAFLVGVVQISDVLQYVWGKLLGRHRIAPSLSPSKTWEGFLGGVIRLSNVAFVGVKPGWRDVGLDRANSIDA